MRLCFSRPCAGILPRPGHSILIAALILAPSVAAGQSAALTGPVALTSWGDPDLQGIWTHGTITPLERPAEYAGRELLTEEEVAALNHASDTRADQREGLTAEQDVALAYNQFWWDRGVSIGRTSLIVDPPDGRLPARVPDAERVATSAEAERARAVRRGRLPASGPEDMDLGDRCLVYRPVPITSSGYNNNVQIAQSPGYVAILQEQIHEIRVIPLDGRPDLGPAVDQWLGSHAVIGKTARSSSKRRTFVTMRHTWDRAPTVT